MTKPKETTELKRSLSLAMLVFYGVGTILGLGIYVLLGKIAGEAGMMAPFSFLFAALIAAFTGLSYGELSARIPKSAGEVNYVDRAFNKRFSSVVILVLALLFEIEALAEATNYILIIVFLMINLALWRIKRRGDDPGQAKTYPIAVPIIGFVLNLAVLIFQIANSLSEL